VRGIEHFNFPGNGRERGLAISPVPREADQSETTWLNHLHSYDREEAGHERGCTLAPAHTYPQNIISFSRPRNIAENQSRVF
jgi:hypothetical protein